MIQPISFSTPVLSYNELMGDIDLNVIQHISLSDPGLTVQQTADSQVNEQKPQLEMVQS